VTRWAPLGARTVGDYAYDVIPEPNGFHTMHVGPNNSDNVWIAVAPELELKWVAEQSFYVPEGPTYDNQGNLYFSPLFPQENVSLVSLDAETGARNWEIEGNDSNAGSGAILILNDPESPGDQIVYHVTYTEAMAIKPDGSILWETPTGLTLPPIVPGERSTTHSFGFNYHPQTDSLVALMMGGEILVFDRVTGDMLAAAGQIPGSPAVSEPPALPQNVIDASDALTDEVFGTTPSGLSFFSTIVDVIFGGGSVVTNYFAIDPNTGRIYVAATADDEEDGTLDGRSELGALYSLELVEQSEGQDRLEISLLNSITFMGGTGSTPSVSEDGSRVFVSDNVGNVIALDRDLDELWRYELDAPAAASIAVSPDNDELYVVTRKDVFKLIDNGDSAELDWIATLDAFADDPEIEVEFQALTPTITANGIAISIGGGVLVSDREVMLKVGMGLLDRDTGRLRSFAIGREESIAVTSVAPDGGIYTASSPVRRAGGKALYPDIAEDIIGGISRYKPVRNDLLARDGSCAAGVRAGNAASISDDAPKSAEQDIRQIRVLIAQSQAALRRAVTDGDLDADTANSLDADLSLIAANLSLSGLDAAGSSLIRVCNRLDAQE
jgi:outer membrane protein assembly factor BamB